MPETQTSITDISVGTILEGGTFGALFPHDTVRVVISKLLCARMCMVYRTDSTPQPTYPLLFHCQKELRENVHVYHVG